MPILFGLVLMALGLPETKWLLFAAGITLHQTTATKLKTVRPTSRDIHDARSGPAQQGDKEPIIERRGFLKMSGYALLGVLIARSLPSVLADTLIPIRRLTASDASYVIFVDSGDGNTIKVKNAATGEIKFSSTNGGLVMQKSIDALPSGGTIFIQPGTYIWSTVPAFPPNLPSWLAIIGDIQTVIRLTNQGPRAFDLKHPYNSGDTFQNIRLEGFTVDCNNTSGTISHVIIGSKINDDEIHVSVNIQDILVKSVNTINVPTDPTGVTVRASIFFSIYQTGAQNTFQRIVAEDCDWHGGNYGFTVIPDLNSNTYMDEIHCYGCKHDTGVVPTGGFTRGGGNFFVGAGGFGHRVTFEDCVGYGSGDVAFEVDDCDSVLFQNCSARDFVNYGFYFVNYQTGFVETQQLVVHSNCLAESIRTPQTVKGVGFGVAYNGTIPLGDFVYDDCEYHAATPSNQIVDNTPSAGFKCYGRANSLTYTNCKIIVDSASQASAVAGYLVGTYIDGLSSSPPVLVNIDNMYVKMRGAKTNTGALYANAFVLQGNLDLSLNDVQVDQSITGIQAGGQVAMLLGASTSTMKGTVTKLTFISATDTAPIGIKVAGAGTLTISPLLEFDECDFSRMSAGSEYYFAPISVAAKVRFDACVSRTGGKLVLT